MKNIWVYLEESSTIIIAKIVKNVSVGCCSSVGRCAIACFTNIIRKQNRKNIPIVVEFSQKIV